jgi:hypothetical protein
MGGLRSSQVFPVTGGYHHNLNPAKLVAKTAIFDLTSPQVDIRLKCGWRLRKVRKTAGFWLILGYFLRRFTAKCLL